MSAETRHFSEAELKKLEEDFDPEARFRTVLRPVAILAGVLMFLLSAYHFYTAGFGIPRKTTHNGLHLGVTLFLVFLSFSALASRREKTTGLVILGLPVTDWVLAFAGAISAFYVPWVYDQIQFRIGNPSHLDVIMGTTLLVVLLEASTFSTPLRVTMERPSRRAITSSSALMQTTTRKA